MEKANLIQRVAFAFVPDGSIRIVEEMPLGRQIIHATKGAELIEGAELLEKTLSKHLADLPKNMDASHRQSVIDAIRDFFGGVMMALTIPAVQKTLEAQCQACLDKVDVLLGKDAFDKPK